MRVLGAVAAIALVVVTAWLAQGLGGPRAARTAALLAAVLTRLRRAGAPCSRRRSCSPPCPPPPSAGCLVLAHRRGRARELAAAGALAAVALLIKQSFLDAGVAGAVFLGPHRAPPACPGPAARRRLRRGGVRGPGRHARRLRRGRRLAVRARLRADRLPGHALGTLSASSVPAARPGHRPRRPRRRLGLVLVLALVPLGLARLGDRRPGDRARRLARRAAWPARSRAAATGRTT